MEAEKNKLFWKEIRAQLEHLSIWTAAPIIQFWLTSLLLSYLATLSLDLVFSHVLLATFF